MRLDLRTLKEPLAAETVTLDSIMIWLHYRIYWTNMHVLKTGMLCWPGTFQMIIGQELFLALALEHGRCLKS